MGRGHIQFRTAPSKYVLLETYAHWCRTGHLEPEGRSGYVALDENALIHVERNAITIDTGFRWDGASGPTVDSSNTMRASLVHDAWYGCIRVGMLPVSSRRLADREMRRILKADGMSWARRWLWYFGLRLFGARNARRNQ